MVRNPGGDRFFTGATVLRGVRIPTLALKWLNTQPVWVLQWFLQKEKLDSLKTLVQEQPLQGHREPSTIPWKTLVFVIKMKSAKLHHDLRKIDSAVETMGTLQAGIPSPTMIPANRDIPVVDMKDWSVCAGSCHMSAQLPGWAGRDF